MKTMYRWFICGFCLVSFDKCPSLTIHASTKHETLMTSYYWCYKLGEELLGFTQWHNTVLGVILSAFPDYLQHSFGFFFCCCSADIFHTFPHPLSQLTVDSLENSLPLEYLPFFFLFLLILHLSLRYFFQLFFLTYRKNRYRTLC